METEAEGRQLGCAGGGCELDRLDELSLRAGDVVGEDQGGGSSEHRGRPPGMTRGEQLARGVGVVEHLVRAVAAAKSLQEAAARIVLAEPARCRVCPRLSVARPPSQR